MPRCLVLFLLTLTLATVRALGEPGDDGPPIAITSPDTGTTYAYCDIKNRSLSWRKSDKILIARVTFTDRLWSDQSANDDTLEFRLPGVTLDEAKGIFYATSAKGEQIPIAHYKKELFLKTIEILPNAHVRIIHSKNAPVTVILEAISPNDPAMHPAPGNGNGQKEVTLPQLFN